MEKEPQEKNNTHEEEKIEMLKKLEKAKSTQERVELFGKVMDTFWVDAIVSLVPELGDAWSSIVSSLYLLSEAKKMWFSIREYLKIVWYQTADILVWAVPVIWDIADYFFKANIRSAKIFAKHFEKIKKEAIKKWVSWEEIIALENDNNMFIKMMNKHVEMQQKSKKALQKNI